MFREPSGGRLGKQLSRVTLAIFNYLEKRS
jgi:hypothetical protein